MVRALCSSKPNPRSISQDSTPQRRRLKVHATIVATLLWVLVPMTVLAQKALLEWFPIRPISLDVVLRQQTFAPTDREFTIQTGITALRYGDIEVRGLYATSVCTAAGSRRTSMPSSSMPVGTISSTSWTFQSPRRFTERFATSCCSARSKIVRCPMSDSLRERTFQGIGPLRPGISSEDNSACDSRLPSECRSISLWSTIGFKFHFLDESKEAEQWVMTTGVRF